jgi:N-acetylmuramoyl-L-alanine amidase
MARSIERSLRTSVPMSPRAIQQAPFRVLVGANMPAVLVEMGYITNGEQEGQLDGESFQSRIVAALADAIGRFFAGDIPAAPPTEPAAATGAQRE